MMQIMQEWTVMMNQASRPFSIDHDVWCLVLTKSSQKPLDFWLIVLRVLFLNIQWVYSFTLYE